MARVVITDHGFSSIEPERQVLEGVELIEAQCRTPEDVIAAAAGADALLVQWAPVTAEVIASLGRARIIVRYGIGVDNVDLKAAAAAGIPVCNVPDYCIEEVADHTMALALALGRQLPQLDTRTRSGVWKLAPVTPMPAFREMLFATAGFGRIARAVLERARAFGFRLGAYDPYVSDRATGIRDLTRDELFREADILSLHVPLTSETHHFVTNERLGEMKRTAILINTSRGGLIDTQALARALEARTIAYAGIDVFEKEPLPDDHPLLGCPNELLSSHMAWYSDQSVPRLQRLAAEEVARALRGEPLKNQVNTQ